jgi:hypothetical protein
MEWNITATESELREVTQDKEKIEIDVMIEEVRIEGIILEDLEVGIEEDIEMIEELIDTIEMIEMIEIEVIEVLEKEHLGVSIVSKTDILLRIVLNQNKKEILESL